MNKLNLFIYSLGLLLLVSSVSAATLHGDIYDLDLNKVENVLVKINTLPEQQLLAKNGDYSFEVPEGEYIIKAQKKDLAAEEKIKITGEGDFVFDLFLFPDFVDEDQLWTQAEDIDAKEKTGLAKYPWWSYLIALGILLIALGRIILAKKKYGKKRKDEKIKEELAEENEPNYLEETLEIIKKHEGRISQKGLRKEMIHLSEAKVSLILTELEHKGKIERIKKGRGKVIILK